MTTSTHGRFGAFQSLSSKRISSLLAKTLTITKLSKSLNDFYHNDRVCHWRVYRLWHGHGSCRPTFILDKKMNGHELAVKVAFENLKNKPFDVALINLICWTLEEQADEIKALREQLIELQ